MYGILKPSKPSVRSPATAAPSTILDQPEPYRGLKAIILSYHGPPNLTAVIKALEKNDYKPVLLVTARGPNYALAPNAFESMGEQVTSTFNAYDDFPILCIKKMSQARPYILAADADIAITMGFPYKIPPSLLHSRTTWINLHPAPLPRLRGPMPFIWPVLRPDLYPISEYVVTAQYMGEEIDGGPIIHERPIKLEVTAGEEFTAPDVHRAALKATCESMEEVIRLVKQGVAGRKQTSIPAGWPQEAKRLTDEERTIDGKLTTYQASNIVRAAFGGRHAMIRLSGELYHVYKAQPMAGSEAALAKIREQPDGAMRTGTTVLQAFSDGLLKLSLRKI